MSSRLLLVGDADSYRGAKLSNSAQQIMDNVLAMAGLRHVQMLNVFNEQPPENNLDAWGIKLPDAQKALRASEVSPEFLVPIYGNKLVVDPARSVPALQRLKADLARFNPNCVVALGNTALNALTGARGIGKLRGAVHSGSLYPVKVLPTYHPAALLKQFDNIPVAAMDLRKANHEAAFPEFQQLSRTIHVIECLDDLVVAEAALLEADYITFDIETKARQITCIGLSGSTAVTYVLPFWSRRSADWSYWPTAESETAAVRWLKKILESSIPKIAQNGLYDIQYLMCYGIAVRNYMHDTMLIQHSKFPSLPKGLDFLGSLYCNERAWKRMRPRKGEQKKEE